MAKPTTRIEQTIPTAAQVEAQALGEVVAAVAQQKDALLAFVQIIGHLHQAGVLSTVQAMLAARHDIGVIGINQMNKSGAQRLIKNSISTMEFMGSIDPAKLKTVLDATLHGLDQAKSSGKQTGLWSMMGTLRDPHVGASLNVMMSFLRGMGEALPQSQGQTHNHV
jgi:uncharacterized protein YjgD (DUF1641 family)